MGDDEGTDYGYAKKGFRSGLANAIFHDDESGSDADATGSAPSRNSKAFNASRDYSAMSEIERLEAGRTGPEAKRPESDDERESRSSSDSDSGRKVAKALRDRRKKRARTGKPASSPPPEGGSKHKRPRPVEPEQTQPQPEKPAAVAASPSMADLLNNTSTKRPDKPAPPKPPPPSGMSEEEKKLYDMNNGGNSVEVLPGNIELSGDDAEKQFVPFKDVDDYWDSTDPKIRAKQKLDDLKCFFCVCGQEEGMMDHNPAFAKVTEAFLKHYKKPPRVLGNIVHGVWMKMFKIDPSKSSYDWPPDCILRHFRIHCPQDELQVQMHVETLDQSLFTLKTKGIWEKNMRTGVRTVNNKNLELYLKTLKTRRELAR
jgi:hypothetical protein